MFKIGCNPFKPNDWYVENIQTETIIMCFDNWPEAFRFYLAKCLGR